MLDNNGQAIEMRHELTRIINNLIKELGDKGGVNWSQAEREGRSLIILSREASRMQIRGRYNHVIEKLKE